MIDPASGPRIGVDVGGTFTDLVLAAADGRLSIVKVPTVPSAPSEGVMQALERAAGLLRTSVSDLLAGCSLFVHGSTVATNILLERKGAKVACLTTEGFRDSLEIRRGMREDPWDHRAPYPEVLVPRYLRRPVAGRIDRGGREVAPLSTTAVEDAARLFRQEGVESVAICLLNSFLDARHEQQSAEILRGVLGDCWVTLSSDVAPVIGEYERGSTAVLNAYVAPRTVSYLRRLDRQLSEAGLPGRLLLIQNNGGIVSVDQIADRPALLLLSGPAAGVGALDFFSRAIGSNDLISMEIGGTSCDVILMSGGRIALTDRLQVDGYDLVTPSVEVHTIGAGGGTIAGVDGAGLLFVGPRGAGARPGPACYGLGGNAPTVTDAQLILGRLRSETYAAGSMAIDRDLAAAAIERQVARPLGIGIEAAATGIIRLMDQKLLHAVQRISIDRGHDPRRFTLVAAGGAGPLHGVAVARRLGCRRVYVPRAAGGFCALGMLHSDVRQDYARVHFDRLDAADADELARIWGELADRASAVLKAEGFTAANSEILRSIDLRYVGQQWEITIPLTGTGYDRNELRGRFEGEHTRLFGHVQPDGAIEITRLRAAGLGRLAVLPPNREAVATAPARPFEHRRVWVDEAAGWCEVPIYSGRDLAPGHRLPGPLIVDEQTTTILLGQGDMLAIDPAANYDISIGEGGRGVE